MIQLLVVAVKVGFFPVIDVLLSTTHVVIIVIIIIIIIITRTVVVAIVLLVALIAIILVVVIVISIAIRFGVWTLVILRLLWQWCWTGCFFCNIRRVNGGRGSFDGRCRLVVYRR